MVGDIATELDENGFFTTGNIYSEVALKAIIQLIDDSSLVSTTTPVYSIRYLLHEIPELIPILFNDPLKSLLKNLGGANYFLSKSIYFDKPASSNWFVSYHQDLSISVAEKHDAKGYKNWTIKRNQFGVQPPRKILESTIAIRIHLDDTDASNGALKVISGSHRAGVIRKENDPLDKKQEVICDVSAGSCMLMKPLLFHASNRSSVGTRRRVIHLEFCNQALDDRLVWAERLSVDAIQ